MMEGVLLAEAGEKVAMQRIEFADRQTNGIVLAVRLTQNIAEMLVLGDARHPCQAL